MNAIRLSWAGLAALALCSPVFSQRFQWMRSWSEAVAAANQDGTPLCLAITCDSWFPASKEFSKDILENSDVKRRLAKGYVCYRIELDELGTRRRPELSPEDRALIQKASLGGYQCLPRVILLTPQERIFGRLGPPASAADFLADLDEWERALRETSAPGKDEGTAERFALSAGQLRNKGQGLQALKDADTAVAAWPSNAHAQYVRALVLGDLGKHAESRQAYFNALSLDSTGDPSKATSTIWAAGSWYNLAVAYLNQKEDERAFFFLRENQRTDFNTDGPMLRMAERQAQAGRPDAGIEEYSELLARNGLNPGWIRSYLVLEERLFGGSR